MNFNQKNEGWFEIRIYYVTPFSVLYNKGIIPYLDNAQKLGAIRKFYFQISNPFGSHIQLMVLGERKVIQDLVWPNMNEFFEDFFHKYPSRRKEPFFAGHLEAKHKWVANNTITFSDFEQKENRYFSSVFTQFVTNIKYLSSQLSLSIYKKHESLGLNINDRIQYSISLNSLMLISFGLDLLEMKDVFNQHKNWELLMASNLKNNEDIDSVQIFEEKYKNQKQDFYNWFEQTLSNRETLDIREKFKNWRFDCSNSFGEVNPFLNSLKELHRPIEFNIPFSSHVAKEEHNWYSIMLELIHSNNNRLGLSEELQAFVSHGVVQTIAGLLNKESFTPVAKKSN